MCGKISCIGFILSVAGFLTACGGNETPSSEPGNPVHHSESAVSQSASDETKGSSPDSEADGRSPEEIARAYMEASARMDEEALNALHTREAQEGLARLDEQLQRELGGYDGFDISEIDEAESPSDETESRFVVGGEMSFSPTVPGGDFEVGDAVIDQDRATVPVDTVLGDGTQTTLLRMKMEAEGWRVYGAKMTSGEFSLGIDYEKLDSAADAMADVFSMEEGSPLGDMMKEFQADLDAQYAAGGSSEEIAAARAGFEAVQVIEQEDYIADWMNDNAFDMATLGEAMNALAGSIGMNLNPGEYKDELEAPVETPIAGLSKLEAIERLAAQAGLHPVYPYLSVASDMMDSEAMTRYFERVSTSMEETLGIEMSGSINFAEMVEDMGAADESITLTAGPRPSSAVFAGPFMIELDSVEENVPYGSGRITLSVRAFNLDRGLAHLLSEGLITGHVTEIRDEHGRSLMENERPDSHIGDAIGRHYQGHYFLDLHNLLRNVTRIETIRGTEEIRLPSKVTAFAFDASGETHTRVVPGMVLTLNQTGAEIEVLLKGEETAVEETCVLLAADDAEGNALGSRHGTHAHGHGGSRTVTTEFASPPARIHVKVLPGGQKLEYPFEIGPIALTRYEEMPETTTELDYGEAPAPLTARFVAFGEAQFGRPSLEAELTNHSNKDIKSAHGEARFIAEDGTSLGDGLVVLEIQPEVPDFSSGEFSMEELQAFDPTEAFNANLIAAGETIRHRARLLGVPEDAISAEISVDYVDFADGAVWHAPIQ